MNRDRPLITIITPSFNSENHIEKLIENVQEQEFRDFEHWVIDGSSTDSTICILSKKSEIYSNLHFISEPDRGIYDAMNKGIIKANGEWLFFLGCDDYFTHTNILKRIADSIKDSLNADIIYGDVWSEVYNRIYEGEFGINKILGQNVCHQSMFFRKQLFSRMGHYDLKYKQNADYQFNLRSWLSGNVMHKYYPIVVSVFSSGGVSSTLGDRQHAIDFPSVITNTTLEGNWSTLRKIEILSQCFRKILIRYPVNVFFNYLFYQFKFLPIKFAAFAWMILSFPYYIIKVYLKRKSYVK